MARPFEVLLVGSARGRQASPGEFGRTKALGDFLGHRMRKLGQLVWPLVLWFLRSSLTIREISKNGDGGL